MWRRQRAVPKAPAGRALTVAILAGEASGDILGAGLIRALRARYPDARFVGIGGPEMLAEGFHSLVPMERLSVMGLVEVLGRIAELVDIRRRVREYALVNRPDVFIGIDSPDFTLGLEGQLREHGIPTVHYVSPSVWAWRKRRVFKIARAVDLMLTLFPFEARFYEEHHVPVEFVGHPLADRVPLQPDQAGARAALGLPAEGRWVALLPGSRAGEVHYLGEVFLAAAQRLHAQCPDVRFILPCVNAARRAQVQALLDALPAPLPITLVDGRSREVMAAADAILLASGTATLEAMLLKRPMVVAYRMSPTSFALLSRLVSVEHIALPNLLAGRALVPELIQDAATPDAMAAALRRYLDDPQAAASQQAAFLAIHEQLRRNADERAADAISPLLARCGKAPEAGR